MEISGEESNDSDCVVRRGRKAAINELEESCYVLDSSEQRLHFFSGYLEQDSAISGMVDDDNPVYVIATVFPIIFDSLFLYIPMINEEAKCLMLDENLKKIALVFRSLIDLPYIIVGMGFIVLAIAWWRNELRDDKKAWVVSLGLYGIIGTLPIPQIAMLVLLPRMKGSNFSDGMIIMNTLILLQYALRVYPFYKLCKSQNKEKLDKSDRSKSYWASGAINFIMYITACHVLGAFWYFFSLQREIDCWIHACKSENGCEISTLGCDDHKTFRNVTLLNDLCPINPSNAMIFDFGIYLDALQSGMLGSTDFPQKFLQCFAWGLRNLSSFGSNLKTSTYAWENLFVALISTSGLLVFIYLLGHLQTFMQTTSRSVWLLHKTMPQIRLMLSEYNLPYHMGSVIWRTVQHRVEDDKYYMENIYSLLPDRLQSDIKLHLFLPSLKKEPMDEELLKEICEHLEPMNFNGIDYIIRQGEPLDMLFFVTQGTLLTYTINIGGSSSTSRLEKGDYYGEMLLRWAVASTSFSNVPISPQTVKSQRKVEVFAITATELQLVVTKFYSKNLPGSPDSTHMKIIVTNS